MIKASFEPNFESWRKEARKHLTAGISPDKINWGSEESLFQSFNFEEGLAPMVIKTEFKVPPEFIELAKTVSSARDADRWDLLYRILYRLQFENPQLLNITVDPDIRRAELLEKSIRRDIHKMHAFVRFKKEIVMTEDGEEEYYVAWHKPEHFTLQAGSPFFARRFGDRKWSIYTPDESAHWNLEKLTFGPGLDQREFTTKDDWDEVWKTYYKSIFNPARIKIKMMKTEMPTKYWSSMPETELIKQLIREAPQRLQEMAKNQNTKAIVDPNKSLDELRIEAKSCQACPLYQTAHNTVFGVGPKDARIMIIGEQPGDQEDLQGLPFIGPAGEILEQSLKEIGLRREDLYLTNAVKHFKWSQHTVRGEKMRLHQKASGAEAHACRPWLEAEIAQVKPEIIIALGATAATAVLGRLPKISDERGKLFKMNDKTKIVISWHPSAILRTRDESEQKTRHQQLTADIQLALGNSSLFDMQ